MNFEELIKVRQSTRKFSDEKVSEEKLLKILNAGNLAPTAKNNQPQKIYVVEKEENLNRIDKVTPCRYNAQTILIVCSNIDEAFKKEDYSTYEMDACIVTTHMMLEATNIGVDNIWVEMFDKELTQQEFNIPSNIKPICLLNLGYKADDCPESPLHNIRKNINEIVEYM